MISDDLTAEKVLIIGAGREGKATLDFLKSAMPKGNITVVDKKDGEDYLKSIRDYDVVIKSPGVPQSQIPAGVAYTSPTQLFFDYCQGTIIGVTGTKGKSTTSSLIYKILKDSGMNAELVGNIGKPAISFLASDTKDKIYIYELSSFQLQNLTKSPHIAVLLNLYEEHLDVHKDFEEYQNAKLNITKWQSENDYLVYNDSLEKILKTKAIKVPFSPKNYSLKGEKVNLLGEFNKNNIQAAFEVAKILEIPVDKITKSIKTFKPLKHRLQDVGTFKGITFYNDSIATNPAATIAAIEALGTDLQTLIVGGLDRGLNYEPLARKIQEANLKVVIAFPTTGEKILKYLTGQKHFNAQNMEEAVRAAYKYTPKGKTCLLSPASASFNMFRDFEQRGDMYIEQVEKQANL